LGICILCIQCERLKSSFEASVRLERLFLQSTSAVPVFCARGCTWERSSLPMKEKKI
jgi:hypothetical protein